MRPTWVEVSRAALQHNFATLQEFVMPAATVCAVVKCDAYGHGAVGTALALAEQGAQWFGVTCVEEAVPLRAAGIEGDILLMSGFFADEEDAVLEHALTPAVFDQDQIRRLEAVAKKKQRPPRSVPVHLKVDTGMTRLGADIADLPKVLAALSECEHVHLDGLMTHFASAEVVDAPSLGDQTRWFDEALHQVKGAGFAPRWVHMANTAAVMSRPQSWHTMVRPGISLYGYHLPLLSVISGGADWSAELELKPALTWKTRVMSVRDVRARTQVGYNGAFITQTDSRLAALPVGYGDGLNRQLSSLGRVIVRGEFAPIVGNISMDITLIDVTAIPGVTAGDEVLLIGKCREKQITAWEHASLCNTIPYETLCAVTKRVPRRYVD